MILDTPQHTPDWLSLAAAHRLKQRGSIPEAWLLDDTKLDELTGRGTPMEGRLIELDARRNSGILTDKENDICGALTASQLVEMLKTGQLTSEEVVTAFCKSAAVAQQMTSCLTEVFFEEAIERAKWLDKKLKESGKVVGPLHGLPISLKDPFCLVGKYTTSGYTECLRRAPETSNSALVELLLDAGAVLYCKTNLPQTMATADSENHIFGRTLCPHKTTLTAGGSSGGEGALVAFRGSPLGVGTDFAGSVRIPALCCGTYGFKPTTNRVPFGGQSLYPFPRPAVPGIEPSAGPLANSIDDLALFMRAVARLHPWKYDDTANDVEWRDVDWEGTKRLTFGILAEDPQYRLHPPVRATIDRTAEILEAAGHKVLRLPFDPATSASLGARIGFQYFMFGGSGLEQMEKELGEPLINSVKKGYHPFSHGGFAAPPNEDKFKELCELKKARDDYAAAWQKLWCQNKLDALVGPAAVSTSVPHDTFGIPLYTTVFNVLDYPAGVIPFGFSSKAEFPEPQKGTAQFDADYDPEAVDGAPCSIQVITPKFHDEECLEVMRIVEREIKQAAPA